MRAPAARVEPAPVLIRVHGMRRSGNHAVIDWLRRNIPGETVFLNDCGPGDPYESFQALESPRGDRHGPSFRGTRWYPQFEAGREGFHHIVSYEDRAPGAAPEGWAAPWRSVVVHRGFLGWLASYFALAVHRQGGTEWGVERPVEIAPMIRLYARLLAAPADASISLERWSSEPGHRARTLRALDLPALDDDTGGQTDYGGGSSFAPGAAPPAAGDLSARWRSLAGVPEFERLARGAARDDAFMGTLRSLYPEDAARLGRLAKGGRLRDER